MIEFERTEEKLTLSQIETIEKMVDLKFPDKYKNHLLNYNGGKCAPNIFSFLENGKISTSSIDWFLAIYNGKYDNLKKYIETYKIDKKRLPNHIVPIAHDAGGNLICISCKGDDAGSIYFWDHENEIDYTVSGDGDYSNLYFVAKSFNEFVDGLKESSV